MPDVVVPDYSGNFINAFEAGQNNMQRMRQRRANQTAANAFSAGRYDEAEGALLREGMIAEAGQYGELGDRRRTRATRGAVSTAMQQAPAGSTPAQRVQAGADAALQQNDPDAYLNMLEQSGRLTAQSIEATQQASQALAARAQSFKQLPAEQRGQAALAALQEMGVTDQNIIARINQMNADGQITDEELDGFAQSSLSFGEQVAQRWQERTFAEQQRQFGLNYGLQARQVAAAERTAGGALNPQQARIWGRDYDREQTANRESLGILDASLAYARAVGQVGGEPTRLTGFNVRASDVALLRAAARSQTGPGVLTESEVWSTLSPSLQQELQNRTAYFDISRQGLNAADRAALAEFVTNSARPVLRQAWDSYENYETRLPEGVTMNSVGLRPPRLPHPDDLPHLSSNARSDYREGGLYTVPSGRTYRYLGQGNWETERVGDEYRPGHRAGGSSGGPTGAQREELWGARGDQNAIRSFNARFGEGAAQRIIQERAQSEARGGR